MALLAVGLFLSACDNDNNEDNNNTPAPAGNGTIELHYELKANGADFVPNQTFVTASQDSVKLEYVRFYLSNLRVVSSTGDTIAAPKEHYLLEKTASVTTDEITLEVPAGDYTHILYEVGVDSVANSALDQQKDDLKVGIGMDWNWNTGYIFWKMEGMVYNADSGKYLVHRYHVGEDPNLQVINNDMTASPLKVEQDKKSMAHYELDLAKVYGNQSPKTQPVVMVMPKPTATSIMNNVGKLFEIHHKHGPM